MKKKKLFTDAIKIEVNNDTRFVTTRWFFGDCHRLTTVALCPLAIQHLLCVFGPVEAKANYKIRKQERKSVKKRGERKEKKKKKHDHDVKAKGAAAKQQLYCFIQLPTTVTYQSNISLYTDW